MYLFCQCAPEPSLPEFSIIFCFLELSHWTIFLFLVLKLKCLFLHCFTVLFYCIQLPLLVYQLGRVMFGSVGTDLIFIFKNFCKDILDSQLFCMKLCWIKVCCSDHFPRLFLLFPIPLNIKWIYTPVLTFLALSIFAHLWVLLLISDICFTSYLL